MKVNKLSSTSKNGPAAVLVDREKSMVKVRFADEEKSRKFDLDECPDYIQNGEWVVNLNMDEQGVHSIKPINAISKAKFIRFTSRQNEPPAPVTKTSTFPPHNPYLAFTAVFGLTEAKYKGMEVTAFFHYLFEKDSNGMTTLQGKGKNLDFLANFLDCFGLLDVEFEFRDNLLPVLQKKLLKADKEVELVIRNGYIEEIRKLLSLAEEDEEEPKPVEPATKPVDPDDEDSDGDDNTDEPESEWEKAFED